MLYNNIVARNQERQFDRQFDSTAKELADKVEFDPIQEKALIYMIGQMRLGAIDIVLNLTSIITDGVDDDDVNMLPSEWLDSLMLEVFDDDGDGEIDDQAKTMLSAHIADAFASLGVDDDVIADLFNSDVDIADVAIENACETVLDNLPADDELDSFVAEFAFGDDDQMDSMFDSAKKTKLAVGKKTVKKVNGKTLTYKAVKAVRNGKVVVVNKRITKGKLTLSSEQKKALSKARKKAHAGYANGKRKLSFKVGVRNGVYKNYPFMAGKKGKAIKYPN